MPETSTTIKSSNRSGLTALVGGAAGFIGSHLCEALLNQNINVIGIDNLANSTRENLKEIISNPRFTFFDFDLNSNKFGIGEGTHVDYIFHVAGAEESFGEKDLSLETLLVNSLGTKHLLDISREKKAKFLLVSSADIYSGALSSTSLNYYFGRVKRDEQILTHHEAKRYAEALTFEYFKKYDVNARICRLLDTYGPRMDLKNGSILSGLINEALNSDRLTIEGDGLQTLHPTYISDVIYGLIKAMLAENTKGKIYQLINPKKTTALSFVEEIKKAFAKNYDTQFKKNDRSLDFPYHTLETDSSTLSLNWQPSIGVIDGLIKTAAGFQNKDTSPIPPQPISTIKHGYPDTAAKRISKITLPKIHFFRLGLKSSFLNRGSLKFTIFLASLGLLLLGVFYPIASLFLNINTASQALQKSLQEVNSRDFSKAAKLANQAEAGWRQADQDLNNLNWLLTLLHLRTQTAGWGQSLFTLTSFSQTVALTAESIGPLKLLGNNWANPQPNFHDYFLNQINIQTDNLSLAADRLAVTEASFSQTYQRENGYFSKQLRDLRDGVPIVKKLVTGLRTAVAVLPEELGFNGAKNYLVLKTDNRILKNSGGIVTDYLEVTLENGHLISDSGGKIENLEKEMTDKINWPAVLKDFKKTTAPTLSDSFWDLDQRKTLKPLTAYYQSRGQNLAGVVLADNSFFKEVGAFTKSGSDLANFKDWTTNLTVSGWENLLNIVLNNFKTKHLLAVLNDEPINTVFEELGFSGSLLNQKVIAEKENNGGAVVADYLLVNIDSLGTGVSNVEIGKNYQVVISSQGLLTGKLRLTLKNKNSVPFQGYVRVLVPIGSVLESVIGNNKSGELVSSYEDKTQIGFLVELEPSVSKELVFSYQLPNQLNRTGPTTYSYTIQKQIGVIKEVINLSFNWASNFMVVGQEPLKVSGDSAGLLLETEQDKTIFFKIQPTPEKS